MNELLLAEQKHRAYKEAIERLYTNDDFKLIFFELLRTEILNSNVQTLASTGSKLEEIKAIGYIFNFFESIPKQYKIILDDIEKFRIYEQHLNLQQETNNE